MIIKAKDNKILLTENTLIFEQSGTKIITGIPEAELVGTTIRDMTINAGDMVISSEGNFFVMKDDESYTDISSGSGGGGGGSGDFLADGSVPMSGDLQLDGNSITDVANISTNSLDVAAGITAGAVTANTVTVASAVNATAATVAVGTLAVLTEATFNNKKLQGVATPEDTTDAATKGYVDTAAPVKIKYSYTYEDFTGTVGPSQETPLFTLPAKAILTEVIVHTTEQFVNDGGDLTIAANVGLTGNISRYVGADIGQPVTGTNFERMPNDKLENMISTTDVILTVESTGSVDDLSQLSAGSFDLYIEYKLLAGASEEVSNREPASGELYNGSGSGGDTTYEHVWYADENMDTGAIYWEQGFAQLTTFMDASITQLEFNGHTYFRGTERYSVGGIKEYAIYRTTP